MKKALFYAAAAACACLLAGISGDYNTWLGYLAGEDADGVRTTVVGAGAGGEAHAADKSTYVGAASGMYSKYATENVAIGYRAMRGSTNCVRCVAIGSGAMQGENGAASCVVIGPNAQMDGMYRDGWTDINGLVRGRNSDGGSDDSFIRLGAPWKNVTDRDGISFNEAIKPSVRFSILFDPYGGGETFLSIKWNYPGGAEGEAVIPLKDYFVR